MKERLQKVLAKLGLGSRRQIEKWIEQGQIKVNGAIATLGISVGETDKVVVNGLNVDLSLLPAQKTRVLLYNKPEGEVCTRNDPEGRPTIFENLPRLRNSRWINVGRLDVNSQGLLLITNNGELAHKLMHPKFNIEREYAVRIFGEVTPAHLKILKKGVELEDGFARFEKIIDGGGEGTNHWYHVILKEGRQREVRRLWESQEGLKVSRLIRVRYGDITLPKGLRRGLWQEYEAQKIKELCDSVGLKQINVSKASEAKPAKRITRNVSRKRNS